MDLVESINQDEGLATHEPALRRVPSVWKKLEELQRAARENRDGVTAYRKYLRRCVASLNDDPEFSVEAAEAAGGEWAAFEEALLASEHVEERGSGRIPSDFEEWSAKHLPTEYEAYQIAFNAFILRPSARSFTNLREAFTNLVQAFVA